MKERKWDERKCGTRQRIRECGKSGEREKDEREWVREKVVWC